MPEVWWTASRHSTRLGARGGLSRSAGFGIGLSEKDLFGEPSWDMLLTLFVAQEDGRDICVSNLCADAAVPATTALRWMLTLVERGLLVRVEDSEDRRRSYVYLSPGARATMRDLLERMK